MLGCLYKKVAGTYTLTGWEYIRRIGQSPAFASIVFYPLVASFLTLHGKTRTILFLPFPIDLSLRVHFLYWALFFLFMGTSIYAARCPWMFKRYNNHLEYAKSVLDILKHPTFASDTTRFIERRLKAFQRDVEDLHPAAARQLEEAIEKVRTATADRTVGHVPEGVIAPLLLAHWQFMNRARPRSRVLIFALYVIGLFLIGIISFFSVGDVLRSYAG